MSIPRYPYSPVRTFRYGYAKTAVNNLKYLGNKNNQIPTPPRQKRQMRNCDHMNWELYRQGLHRGSRRKEEAQRKTSMLLPKTKQENSCLICSSFSGVKFFMPKSQLSSLTIQCPEDFPQTSICWGEAQMNFYFQQPKLLKLV